MSDEVSALHPYASRMVAGPRLSRMSSLRSSHCTCSFSKAFCELQTPCLKQFPSTVTTSIWLSALQLCGLVLGLHVQPPRHLHHQVVTSVQAGFTVCLPGTILQGGPGLCSSTESRCSAFTSVLVSRGFEHQFNGTVDAWQPPFLWWCWARVAFHCCRSDC